MSTSALIHQHTPQLIVTDPRGLSVRSIAYQRRSAGEPITAHTNRQVFNANGHLRKQWDPRLLALTEVAGLPNQTTRYSLTGQVLQTESVDAGLRVFCKDSAGLLRESWDGRETHRSHHYDQFMRLVSVFEQSSTDTPQQCMEHFTYAGSLEEDVHRNRSGQLIRHDDQAGSLTHEAFGLHGQPLAESRRFCTSLTAPNWPESESGLEPEVYTTRWQHDALGTLVEQVDALGHVHRFVVDLAGRPKASWLDGLAILKHTTYNAFGQLEIEQAGNDVITTACYSPVDGLLQSLNTAKLGGNTLQNLHYQYDPVGNIQCIEDLAQPVQWFAQQRIQAISTYTYDSLYQLTNATGRECASQTIGPGLPGVVTFAAANDSQWRTYSQTYTYDSSGNLTRLKHEAGPGNTYIREMVVDERSNRCVLMNGSPIHFDANGNQQALVPGQLMQWDSRNQLRQITHVQRDEPQGQDDDTETYVYDGSGQRVRKVRRAKTRGGEQISEVRYLPGLEIRTRTSGEQLHVLIARTGRNGVRLLHWDSVKPEHIDNDQLRYSLSDHLGSSTLEVDQNVDLISQESYYPYGGTAWWAAKNVITAHYKTVRYSGKERDATGLYYYGYRYYSPWLNRWINPDPVGDVEGLNLFRMVRNNPVRLRDSDGRLPEDAEDDYSEQSPSAMAAGYQQDPQTFRRRDIDEQTAAARQMAVANELTHTIHRANTIDSVYTAPSIPGRYRFKNEYLPGRWRMMENFRAPAEGPNATDVTWQQYEQVSRQNNFYGVLPKVIVRWDVINAEALRATNQTEGMLERFLASEGNGRSTQRLMNAFGLRATAIERREVHDARRGADIDIIAVHVEPVPLTPSLSREALRKEVERELRRASRQPVSRAAHSVWRTLKRMVLPARTQRALR